MDKLRRGFLLTLIVIELVLITFLVNSYQHYKTYSKLHTHRGWSEASDLLAIIRFILYIVLYGVLFVLVFMNKFFQRCIVALITVFLIDLVVSLAFREFTLMTMGRKILELIPIGLLFSLDKQGNIFGQPVPTS